MIYLDTIKTSLVEYFNLSKPLSNQQKIVYAVASAIFTAICAFSIYCFYRAYCLKKELSPVDEQAKEVADQAINQKNQEPAAIGLRSFSLPPETSNSPKDLSLTTIGLRSSKIEVVNDKSSGESAVSGSKLDDLKPIASLTTSILDDLKPIAEPANHTTAETPQAETPQAETPQAETPQVETPQAETPQAETPQAETPQAETPQVETPQAETPQAEPTEVKSAKKALNINDLLDTANWTKEEIKKVNQAIPNWLVHHTNFEKDQKDYLEQIFKESCKEIPEAASLEDHLILLKQQINNCINILSAHSEYDQITNAKVPILLRALHIPQIDVIISSDRQKAIYTFIIQQAWTKIVQEGKDNCSYSYTLKNGGMISEDSLKILQQVVEDNKDHPKGAKIHRSFSNQKWETHPAPKIYIRGPALAIAISKD